MSLNFFTGMRDDEHKGPVREENAEEDGTGFPGPATSGKRKHVHSRRMQEYLQQQDQTPPQKIRKCTFSGCDKVFSSGPGLRYHLHTHSQDARRFTCESCKKEFKSHNGLKYHRDKTKCQDLPGVEAVTPSSPHQPSSPPKFPHSPSAACIDSTPTIITATTTITTTTTTMERRSSSEKDETDSMQVPTREPPPAPQGRPEPPPAPQGQPEPPPAPQGRPEPPPAPQGRPEPPPAPQGWPEPRHRKMESRRKQMKAAAHHLQMEEGCQDQLPPALLHPAVFPPHPLEHAGAGEEERLLEFAKIATGPQSPLMRSEATPIDWERAGRLAGTEVTTRDSTAGEGGVNTCPPSTVTPITCTITHPPGTSIKAENDGNAVTSSYFLPTSPKEWDSAQGLSHEWPTASWQCFMKGTKVCLDKDSSLQWYPVEVMAMSHLQGCDPLPPEDLVHPTPLRLVSKQKSADCGNEVELEFESQTSVGSHLIASCTSHHPFFVRNKGWASCNTSRTKEMYGIASSPLEIDDICLPSSHAQQVPSTKDSERSEVKSLELSTYAALSKMAQRRSQESTAEQQPSESTNRQKVPKAKRPMNAFLLWSQTKRAELIVKFPRTNNRDISSMLAREWHRLSTQEKRDFQHEAKLKAELQKQQHPDCWKRKHRVQH